MTWKNNWWTRRNQIPGKHEETRGKKRRKETEKKGTEEKNRFSFCQIVSWSDAQLPFVVFNAWMCVDINRACFWKRTRQPTHLQNDLAMLATWLLLLCMTIIQHDSIHFLMKIRNVHLQCLFDEQLVTIKLHSEQECITCYRPSKHNPPQQFSLDAKWRITGHCEAYHTVLAAAMHAIPS